MARNQARPLSPHLTIWKWGPHMAVSIFHRATGSALAIAGGVLFTWWLVAAAMGKQAYARFIDCVTYDAPAAAPGAPVDAAAHGGLTWFWLVVLIGLSWAFFQHMASGVRHFVLDTGAGYELRTNKTGSVAVFAFSIIATILLWAGILGGVFH
ncbi:succinate:quinone oxidoreductase subunit C [Sphingomonas sp. 1P06PA]|uniref:succinate dehydrogenase, cytochrome b556 subunit n=1 Tax=Sphingomonas sp. 1P06PA TaxID=554121 RepID=UPI0039A43E85